MKKLLPLILAAIIIPSCAVALVVARVNLSTAKASLDETRMSLGYSCAFLAGQYNIMNAMPEIFPDHHDVPPYCTEFKEMAARHGFTKS